MQDPTERAACHYSTLNDSIWSACKGKASQCSNMKHPSLVAIGTFHTAASAICVGQPIMAMLLTGETMITWDVNVRTGSQVGDTYLQTKLYSSAFLRPDKTTEIGYARSSISGLLICGLGIVPPKVLGILHPNPARPFNHTALNDISFGKLSINRDTRTLSVSWTGPSDD